MLRTTPHVSRSADHVEPALDIQGSGVRSSGVRTLFDEEETPLLRYAFSLVGRRAVAEELVQEVFLQLHVHWDNVESPRAWLYQCVRNRAANHFRDHRKETIGSEKEDGAAVGDLEDDPEEILSRIESIGRVRDLLTTLDETDRRLVQLKYFEGRSYREIGQETGLSVGNVGYRLHHLLKTLAVQLRKLGIDQES